MQDWILSFLSQYGYVGIGLLIALENVFPPIPSEIILTFGGFLASQSNMHIWLVSLSATVGSLAGALVLYGVGRLVSPQRILWILDRWGRVLRVRKRDLKRAESWFVRRGSLTVFLCRFIPIVRSLISVPAGMARMSMGKFLLYTVLGTAVWNTVLIYLGALAGSNWEHILRYFDTYSNIACAGLVLACICFLLWYLKKRKARGKSADGGADERE
jgi:membrane protein DedA with SNARE-associated domain